ncbi:MAG: LytTR family DNA-binding domain-containing protein [Acidobacteriaceae bacterium]
MRALIVDDERLARQELRRLLQAHADVSVEGEARNADEAEDLLERLEPELLFLDIQMPGRSGLTMLEQCANPPQTILTTAFDQYALRGFELNAVDYLLKPIAAERLSEALRRVRLRMEPPASPAAGPVHSTEALMERIFVRDGDACWLVRVEEIRLLQSEGNYTRVFFQNHRPMIPRSLAQIEPRLSPGLFIRANRSQIVNLGWISGIAPEGDGYLVGLRDGPEVAVSRRQAKQLRDRLTL